MYIYNMYVYILAHMHFHIYVYFCILICEKLWIQTRSLSANPVAPMKLAFCLYNSSPLILTAFCTLLLVSSYYCQVP